MRTRCVCDAYVRRFISCQSIHFQVFSNSMHLNRSFSLIFTPFPVYRTEQQAKEDKSNRTDGLADSWYVIRFR